MEQLTELKNWLMGFPGWEDNPPAVDCTGAEPGDCALFPIGLEVVSSREDVLGNTVKKLRQTYLLRRTAPRGADSAAWGMEFTRWANENAGTAPVLGAHQQLRCERSRLISPASAALGTYEVRLTFEYEKEKHYG